MSTHVADTAQASVLVVDDEVRQLTALCDTLEDTGYKTAGFRFARHDRRGFFVRDNGPRSLGLRRCLIHFSACTPPQDFPGTGIRLATVHRMIRNHGGDIRPKVRAAWALRFTSHCQSRHGSQEISRTPGRFTRLGASGLSL